MKKRVQSKRSAAGPNFLLSAIVLAILIHGLLLVFFRANTANTADIQGELPMVVNINLQRPENADLAQWIMNNDPALMTAVDHRHGFSTVVRNFYMHKKPGDLPYLPHLQVPGDLGPAQLFALDDPRSRYIMPRLLLSEPVTAAAPRPATAFIWVDGRRMLQLEKQLDVWMEQKSWPASTGKPAAPTVIHLTGKRTFADERDFLLISSSQRKSLDMAALQLLRSVLLGGAMSAELQSAREAAFVWQINVNEKEL